MLGHVVSLIFLATWWLLVVADQVDQQQIILEQSDLVYLSKLRHSLHKLANVDEQCSQFLRVIRDKYSGQGLDGMQQLEIISKGLRQRNSPYGNLSLANFLELCLSKETRAPQTEDVVMATTSGQVETEDFGGQAVDRLNQLESELDAVKERLAEMERLVVRLQSAEHRLDQLEIAQPRSEHPSRSPEAQNLNHQQLQQQHWAHGRQQVLKTAALRQNIADLTDIRARLVQNRNKGV